MMKNGLVVLNVVLLIAVCILFYLHFRSAKKISTQVSKTGTVDSFSNNMSTNGSRIAYFEMDSIDQRFEMVKEVKDQLNKKEEDNQRIANNLDKQYEKRYNELGTVSKTPEQIEAARQELTQMQADHNRQKQGLMEQRNTLQLSLIQEIQKNIEDYLKEFNKSKGYNFILSYEPGLIYYKDTMFNITPEIIKGLNEQYKKKKLTSKEKK